MPQYKSLKKKHRISEIDAMKLCSRGNRLMVSLVEYFNLEGVTYLVTKFAKRGDLMGYLEHQLQTAGESD